MNEEENFGEDSGGVEEMIEITNDDGEEEIKELNAKKVYVLTKNPYQRLDILKELKWKLIKLKSVFI